VTSIGDFSHWNWDYGVVDLSKYASWDGFIFKATQGTWMVDDCMEECVEQARELSKPYSLYHFLDPIMDGYQDGNEQYEYFMDNTEGLRGDTLPNALDAEWQGPLSNHQYTNLVMDFLEQPGDWLLYANLYFLNSVIRYPEKVSRVADIWLSWPSATSYPRMPLYYPKEEVKLWQYDWHDFDKNKVLDQRWYDAKTHSDNSYHTTLDIPTGYMTIDIKINLIG